MSREPEAPLGVFEEHVLLAVMRTHGESFGMEIRRELETVTGRDVAIGAVYATLDRLEEKSLIRSRRASVDGRNRRTFQATRAGAHALLYTKSIRDRLWNGVDLEPMLAR
jgi:PadR family transcriptional regulator PadR